MSTLIIASILLAVATLTSAVVILVTQEIQIQKLESRLVAYYADMLEQDMKEQQSIYGIVQHSDEESEEEEKEEESMPTSFDTVDIGNHVLVSDADFDLLWPYYITKGSAQGTHNHSPERRLFKHSNNSKGSKKKSLAHVIECMQRFIVSQGCIDNGVAGTFA